MNNRHYAIAAAVFLLATSTHADDASVAAKSTTSSSGGENVYSTICQGCHMPGGSGAEGAGHYPKLAGNPAFVSWEYIAITVLNGRNGMPPFGLAANAGPRFGSAQLSDAQIAEVVNYVRTHFGNKYPSKVTAKDVAALPHPGAAHEDG
ncbi:MAG: c-type cytochrome [Povalibacter sp.]